MITKYIGSVDEFLNCEAVAFVNVRENYTLVESNIPEYVTTNEIFSHVKLVNRNSDGIFIAEFLDEEKTGFIIDYLIMYNSIGEPIGFCNLTQNIDLIRYGIESIALSFDYTIVNKTIILNVRISYQSHLIRTSQKTAHQILFDNNQGYQAVSKSTIVATLASKKLYTKNILEISRDPELLYRYSGNLSRDFYRFTEEVMEVNTELFNSILFYEMVSIDNQEYLLLYDGTQLHIVANGRVISYTIFIESQLHIGANFIVGVTDQKYKLYPTRELVKGTMDALKTNTRQYTQDGVNLVIEDLILDEIHICKNPITKNLMMYTLDEEGLKTNDKELTSIFEFFGNPRVTDQVPIFAADGSLFLAQLDGNKIIKSNWVTYNLPGRVVTGGIESDFDLVTYFDEEDNVSPEASEVHKEAIKTEYDLLMQGLSINDLVFVSPELLLVLQPVLSESEFRDDSKCTYDVDYMTTDVPEGTDDPYIYYVDSNAYNNQRGLNRFLLHISTEFNYNPKAYDFESKLEILRLVGRTGLRNYDKIFKSNIRNINKIDITKLVLNGNIYGSVEESGVTRLYRL